MINKPDDLIGGPIILFRSTDICQRNIRFIGNDLNSIFIKTNVRQSIFLAQTMEKTMFSQKIIKNLPFAD